MAEPEILQSFVLPAGSCQSEPAPHDGYFKVIWNSPGVAKYTCMQMAAGDVIVAARVDSKDHLGRDAKDFAIEFGEYLATAAELFVDGMAVEIAAIKSLIVSGDYPDGYNPDAIGDINRALQSAIYEFRKRAAKAKGSL